MNLEIEIIWKHGDELGNMNVKLETRGGKLETHLKKTAVRPPVLPSSLSSFIIMFPNYQPSFQVITACFQVNRAVSKFMARVSKEFLFPN